jgi:hypothetical protein
MPQNENHSDGSVVPIDYETNNIYEISSKDVEETTEHKSVENPSFDEAKSDEGRVATGERGGAASTSSTVNQLWPLEPGDEGYYHYEPKQNQYGNEAALNVIRDVGAQWVKMHSENPIGVGDISVAGGGAMKGHAGHTKGLEIDIRLMRNDGKLAGTDYRSKAYSRELTQDLVNTLRIIRM